MAENKPLIKTNDQQLPLATKRRPFELLVLLAVMFMAVNNIGWWIFSDDEAQQKKPAAKQDQIKEDKKAVPAPVEKKAVPAQAPQKPVVKEKKKVEPKKVEIKKEEKKKPAAAKKESKKSAVKGGGASTSSAVKPLPVSYQPVKPINRHDVKLIKPVKVPVVHRVGASAPPKAYHHISAELLTGRKPAKVPESIKIQQKAERDMAQIKKSLENLPQEIGMDKSNPIGQATLANGTRIFIEYDKNNNPIKVAYLYKNGKKVIKKLDENGRAETITIDNKTMFIKYSSKPEGQTEITFVDSNGNVAEKRLYSDKGLILEQENDKTGEVYKYRYEFENAIAVSYVKLNKKGIEVAKGDINDIEDIHMKTFFFSSGTDGTVNSYTYINDDKGNLVKVIENQNTENEVIRYFDGKLRLIKIENKKIGTVYQYKYDEKSKISRITIKTADGKERVLKPGDPEFDVLESEIEQFDPVQFGKKIMQYRALMNLTGQNVLRKNIKDAARYRSLPSARQLNTKSVQPVNIKAPAAALKKVDVPAVNVVPAPAPAPAPASAVPARSTAIAPSTPGAAANVPARAPAGAPSVPGR